MAKIKVHAGDFLKGDSSFGFGIFSLRTEKHSYVGETIHGHELEHIEVASEESVKKIGGTLGWGAIGALALGPVGLLAGILLGGKKQEVTFVAKFKDGRRLLATTDSKTYNQLQAILF
jgi:hypothetical protein